jgi:anti-anti-sigma regulatory factor
MARRAPHPALVDDVAELCDESGDVAATLVKDGDALVFVVPGELECFGEGELEHALTVALAGGTTLMIDFGGAPFTSVKVIQELAAALTAGADFSLRCPSPVTMQLIALFGLAGCVV